MIVKWTPRARRELVAQLKFIALDKPSAAERMAGLVAESTSLLGSHPEMGRLSQTEGLRELPIAGTPFLAIYRLMPKRVEILRLLDGAQKWP